MHEPTRLDEESFDAVCITQEAWHRDEYDQLVCTFFDGAGVTIEGYVDVNDGALMCFSGLYPFVHDREIVVYKRRVAESFGEIAWLLWRAYQRWLIAWDADAWLEMKQAEEWERELNAYEQRMGI